MELGGKVACCHRNERNLYSFSTKSLRKIAIIVKGSYEKLTLLLARINIIHPQNGLFVNRTFVSLQSLDFSSNKVQDVALSILAPHVSIFSFRFRSFVNLVQFNEYLKSCIVRVSRPLSGPHPFRMRISQSDCTPYERGLFGSLSRTLNVARNPEMLRNTPF